MPKDFFMQTAIKTTFTCTALSCATVAFAAPESSTTTASTLAKEDGALPEMGAGEIIVTAQKRQESANRVGMSITALGGEELTNLGVSDVADLVKVIPGFNFTRSAYGAPILTLRGIGFYDTSLGAAPTVSVYVDEAPIPLSIMSAGATLDLERVEVLKGPQGILFGQNATGGAINYIAAKPTDYLAAGVDLTYGRFDDAEANGFVSGPLSETLRARIAVKYARQGDWQKSYTRDAKSGEGELLVGRLLLDWDATDRLALSLNLNGYIDRSDNQAGQFIGIINDPAKLPAGLVSYPVSPRSNRAADWGPGGEYRRKIGYYQMSLRGDYELTDDIVFTSLSTYQSLDRRSVVDADGTSIEAFTVDTPGQAETFNQEVRLAGGGDRLHWLVGGNYSYENIRDTGSPTTTDSSFPFSGAIATSNQKVNTWAAFAHADVALSDTLRAEAGLRYTTQRRNFNGCLLDNGTGDLAALFSGISSGATGETVVIPSGGCATLGSDFFPATVFDTLKEDNISWKAGLNWQAQPQTLLYANISRGYKSGAFPTAGATFAAQLAPASQESVLAYEAGFKVGLFNRTVQLNGAVFHYDYSDKQVRGKVIDINLGPLNALINIPNSKVTGAELDLTVVPTEGLTLKVAGTYVDSQIGEFQNVNAIGANANMKGEAFPLTPKWQVNANFNYETPLNEELKIFFGGSMTYQSSTNGGLGELPLLAINNYMLLDARAGIGSADERWKLTAFIKNISNEYYWNLAVTPGPDAAIRYAGRPRTWGLTMSFRY